MLSRLVLARNVAVNVSYKFCPDVHKKKPARVVAWGLA